MFCFFAVVTQKLSRDVSDNYEHMRISFVRSLFSSQRYFGSRKTKVNSNGNIYITMPPKTRESKLKQSLIYCGGYQTNFRANKEVWKADGLSHEQLSFILNDGRSFIVIDENGFEFEPSEYARNNCCWIIKEKNQT